MSTPTSQPGKKNPKKTGSFTVQIHQPWCKGCYICIDACHREVFETGETLSEKGFRPVNAVNTDACDGCLQCEALCPDLAISVASKEEPVEGPMIWSVEKRRPPGRESGEALSEESHAAVERVDNVLPAGTYYLQGDEACADGAVAAGCRFYAGYPITPASEIMHRIVHRFHETGGTFIQMEDEIGSIGAMIGASWSGARSMTATSGPGLSLMMENIGYAAITETPIVIVDIQRAGPSTGQATRPGSGDVYQVKYGSHGDYEIIALSPWSVQEMYDMTIEAFNLADRYRVPVFLLADEGVGHLRENVTVQESVERWGRPSGPPGSLPFDTIDDAGIPPMFSFGDGEQLLITGSTHDGMGYRKTAVSSVHRRLVKRINDKIRSRVDELTRLETHQLDDAEVAVVAYGFTARAAIRAVKQLRGNGIRAGLLRLRYLWPFPDDAVRQHLESARHIVVPELNRGQVSREVARIAGSERVQLISQIDGEVMKPATIAHFVEDLVR